MQYVCIVSWCKELNKGRGENSAPNEGPIADTEVCLKSFRCQEIMDKLQIQRAQCDFTHTL